MYIRLPVKIRSVEDIKSRLEKLNLELQNVMQSNNPHKYLEERALKLIILEYEDELTYAVEQIGK